MIEETKKFARHLLENGVGILVRRGLDWLAAVNATLATNGFSTIPAESAEAVFSLTGNAIVDLGVSAVAVLLSRFLSYKKDQ